MRLCTRTGQFEQEWLHSKVLQGLTENGRVTELAPEFHLGLSQRLLPTHNQRIHDKSV